MNTDPSHFTPEAIEQQTIHSPTELTPEESRLVQHIYALSQSYAHKNAQSLERIWERLQQSQEAFLPNKQGFLERIPMNTNDTMQQTDILSTSEQGTLASLPGTRPRRRFRRKFALAVAILVAAVWIGVIVTLVPHPSQPGGFATAGSASTPSPTSALIPGQPFPAQDCPSHYDVAKSAWYQLCRAGLFVTVNQSRSLAGHTTESLLAAYADQNALILISDLSPLKDTDVVNIQNAPITAQGTPLEALGGSYGFSEKQHRYTVSTYDTSNLSVSLTTLTITIRSRVGLPGDNTSLKAVTFSTLSLPLHSAKILTPNQTVTANQTSITLSKVVMSASGTHIVFAAPHLPDVALNHGFHAQLQSGKISVSDSAFSLITTKGTMTVIGFACAFDSNLTTSHGVWTLTVTATGEPHPWVFQFTAPA